MELTAAFTEERQRVLAENVANIDTPDYHVKRLDQAAFQQSLLDAIEQSREDRMQRVQLRGNAQFTTKPSGQVLARPDVSTAPNVLFHDGTNTQLESLMSDVNGNVMWHELALNLLKQRYGALLTAIRGKSG
ncbi:MAG: hypothetical protein JXO22_04290 [Phycisphaerae bacterium]|nr:hypothetical protein [Phycisphaerae bacterium]